MTVATRRRVYDDATKREAIALAIEVGPAEAARRLGLTSGTIRSWCSRADVATVTRERTRAAVEANRLRWDQRRGALCDRIGEVAEKALDVCDRALDKGETRKASDASATVARLVDKAQLLSGGSTARIGSDTDRTRVLEEAHGRGLALVSDAA